MNHPSFLALDRFSIGQPDPEVERHLKECTQCSQHLDSLRKEIRFDPSLRQRASVQPAPSRRWLQLGFIVPVAAALMLFVLPTLQKDDSPLRSKGAPSVTVHLKRGEQVVLWTETMRVRVGDRLQLTVQSPEPTEVEVVHAGQLLHKGAVASPEQVALPFSLRVTDSSEPEIIDIKFMQHGKLASTQQLRLEKEQ